MLYVNRQTFLHDGSENNSWCRLPVSLSPMHIFLCMFGLSTASYGWWTVLPPSSNALGWATGLSSKSPIPSVPRAVSPSQLYAYSWEQWDRFNRFVLVLVCLGLSDVNYVREEREALTPHHNEPSLHTPFKQTSKQISQELLFACDSSSLEGWVFSKLGG